MLTDDILPVFSKVHVQSSFGSCNIETTTTVHHFKGVNWPMHWMGPYDHATIDSSDSFKKKASEQTEALNLLHIQYPIKQALCHS